MPVMSGRELMTRLNAGDRFLADGAMGTELIAQGVPPDKTLHANSLFPEKVLEIHRRYMEAGARILSSNTFGAGDPRYWEMDFANGIDLAVRTVKCSPHQVALFLSITCATAKQLVLSKILPDAWPMGILIETCVSLDEALEADRFLSVSRPELLAITCHFRADGRMPDGTRPEMVAHALKNAGVHIIGANCGDDPHLYPEIAARMRSVTNLPLLFQPSAGLPTADRNALDSIQYPITPEGFHAITARLFDADVNIVGGCCGTTPEYIGTITPLASQHIMD